MVLRLTGCTFSGRLKGGREIQQMKLLTISALRVVQG